MADLTPHGAPDEPRLSICPHCWYVNVHALRLCGRCGADMALALQESGGLRLTAPVQSPVPVRAGRRLTTIQRLLMLAFVALLGLGSLAAGFAHWKPPVPPSARPASATQSP